MIRKKKTHIVDGYRSWIYAGDTFHSRDAIIIGSAFTVLTWIGSRGQSYSLREDACEFFNRCQFIEA